MLMLFTAIIAQSSIARKRIMLLCFIVFLLMDQKPGRFFSAE